MDGVKPNSMHARVFPKRNVTLEDQLLTMTDLQLNFHEKVAQNSRESLNQMGLNPLNLTAFVTLKTGSVKPKTHPWAWAHAFETPPK